MYLAGGAGLCFILYKLLGLLFGIIPILIVAGSALALTFYKPNNKPFINLVQSAFIFLIGDKLYIWKRRKSKSNVTKGESVVTTSDVKRQSLENSVRLGGNKLRDLAWSLDVLDLKKSE